VNPFKNHPSELRRLFFVELWERFSYFGLSAILILFMTSSLAEGGLGWEKDKALMVNGAYGAAIYLLAIPFSMVADRLLGATTAVLMGAILIMIGHVTLALPLAITLFLGLALVAIGTGFLKPSISGLVGDLYAGNRAADKNAGMTIFYMSISVGGLLGPLVLGYIHDAKLGSPGAAWHLAFAAAAIGMGFALVLFIPFWKSKTPVKKSDSVNLGLIGLVFLGSAGLLGLLVWGTSMPHVIWGLYALIPCAALYFGFQKGKQRQAIWMVMLLISTLVSAVIGQMISGLTLVIKDNVALSVFGWSFPVEYFAGFFSGFIILFSLINGNLKEGKASFINYTNAFTFGTAGFALALAIIGLAFMVSGGAKISAWVIIISYALKAASEVLIVPTALALMHDVSSEKNKSVTMAIWFLGAGLGVNMAKMLGISMDKVPMGLGQFFLLEAAGIALFAATLWYLSKWLVAQVEEIKAAKV